MHSKNDYEMNSVICSFSKFRFHTLQKKVMTNDILTTVKHYTSDLVIHIQNSNIGSGSDEF